MNQFSWKGLRRGYPTMDRDQFFAMLDELNTSQIEARLSLWDDEQLKLVEEYLERRTIRPAQGKHVHNL
jgi:hypothetical protein